MKRVLITGDGITVENKEVTVKFSGGHRHEKIVPLTLANYFSEISKEDFVKLATDFSNTCGQQVIKNGFGTKTPALKETLTLKFEDGTKRSVPCCTISNDIPKIQLLDIGAAGKIPEIKRPENALAEISDSDWKQCVSARLDVDYPDFFSLGSAEFSRVAPKQVAFKMIETAERSNDIRSHLKFLNPLKRDVTPPLPWLPSLPNDFRVLGR